MPPSFRLVIFLKAPQPGRVKTRLAAGIGPEAACAAYRELVDCLVLQLRGLPGVELRFSPDGARAEIQNWLQPTWIARPQGKGDLGEKLVRAFEENFADGCSRVVVIGSDCPHVQPADILAAGEALAENDVVLGPARDGGYWLIALKAPCRRLFADIRWSTPAVLSETLHRVSRLGLSVHQLRELEDVDDEASWQEFLNAKL